MKTCTLCGREWSDEEMRCPIDGAPLEPEPDEGAARVASTRRRLEVPLDPEEDDPETVVNARRAVPIPPPNFTRARVASERSTGDLRRERPPSPPPPPRDERSLWPAVLTISLLALAAVGGLLYYIYSQQSWNAAEINRQIVDARVAVTDARARIESLPPEHPLRRQILNLDRWERELLGFEASLERTPEMALRAREIATQARNLAEDARAAYETPTNALPPPTNANTNALAPPAGEDPMAPPTPAEEPVEPDPERPAAQEPDATNTNAIEPPRTDTPPPPPPVTNRALPGDQVSPPRPGTRKAPPAPAAPAPPDSDGAPRGE